MAQEKQQASPLLLALHKKQDGNGVKRAFDPPESHRPSVASTGVSDGHTPLYLSPEVTYRGPEPTSLRPIGDNYSGQSYPNPAGKYVQGTQRTIGPRRAIRVSGESPLGEQTGNLMSFDIIYAKKHGYPLPELRERHYGMIDEGITRTPIPT